MIRALAIAVILTTLPAIAAADEPVGCNKFKWPVDREQVALISAMDTPEAGQLLEAPFAVVPALLPAADARLPRNPERAPKDGTFAAAFRIKVPAAGTWSIALVDAAWIDLIQDGVFLKPSAIGDVEGCDGLRKVVRYDLPASEVVLQISDSATATMRIAFLRPL